MSSASSITRNNGFTEGFHNKMELVIAKPTASATSKTADSAPRYYMIDSLDGVLPGMGSNHEFDSIKIKDQVQNRYKIFFPAANVRAGKSTLKEKEH